MSIHKERDGIYRVRWREGGRNRSIRVHGSHELAKKIERKKMSARDENRHLDVRREINFRMSALIARYQDEDAGKKKSWNAKKAFLKASAKICAIYSFAKWPEPPSKNGTED